MTHAFPSCELFQPYWIPDASASTGSTKVACLPAWMAQRASPGGHCDVCQEDPSRGRSE